MKTLDVAGISVYVEKDAHPIYEELVSRSPKQAEDRPFETMKDLFVFAACLGAANRQYKEMGSSRDIFSGETFSAKADIPVLAALAYAHTRDIEILSNPKGVIEIAQCWANGGIHLVRAELLGRPGRPLNNLVTLVLGQNSPTDDTG